MSKEFNFSLIAASLCGSIHETVLKTDRSMPGTTTSPLSTTHTTYEKPDQEKIKEHVSLYFKILTELKTQSEAPDMRQIIDMLDN